MEDIVVMILFATLQMDSLISDLESHYVSLTYWMFIGCCH